MRSIPFGVHSIPTDPRPLRFRYTDTRRWVMIGSTIGTLAYALLLLVNVREWGWASDRHQAALVMAAAGCAIGGLLAWGGRVFQGGVVALIAVWSEVHFSLLHAHEFPVPSLLATSAVMVAGALLLKPRHSAILAIGSIVITWPLVLLSPAVRASGVTAPVLYWLTAHAVVSCAVWSLVTLGFSIVDRAFAAVLRKERELAETIDRAPDGILVIDATDALQVMNPAAERLLGLAQSACIGQPLDAVLAKAAARVDVRTPAALADNAAHPATWSVPRADGTSITLECTWRTMDEGRRQFILRDVSERLRAEHARRDMELQLAHAQRLEAVGQLAGGIAHDFNNILTVVGASAEVLRADLHDEQLTAVLDEIIVAQARGATLTKQLLAFARRDVVHPRVFDLSRHVVSLQRLLQRVVGEQTRVTCTVEPDCRIRADLGQVEQALVNLVTNARDAMPDGGTCQLRVSRTTTDDGEAWVCLAVCDDGVGMDGATSARAFEPFFTTKPRGRGTGLGLAAVHGTVMQSGGRTRIESVPGRGTTVMLEFPFAHESPSVTTPTQPVEQSAGGGTILVAEDDAGTRATVARILTRLGYEVLLAQDGLQALQLAEEHRGRIDLLLTDVMMPGLGGPQLARRLHAQSPEIPVLFMSGYPEDALTEVQGLHLETDFVPKPFTSAVLARRVADKLGASSRVTQDA